MKLLFGHHMLHCLALGSHYIQTIHVIVVIKIESSARRFFSLVESLMPLKSFSFFLNCNSS